LFSVNTNLFDAYRDLTTNDFLCRSV